MNLHSDDALESAALLIQIDHIHGGNAVDPVLMVIALDSNPILVPFIARKLLNWHLAYDPGLAGGINDDLFACMSQDSAAAFFIEHAIVVGVFRDDIALISGDDPFTKIGAFLAPVLKAAVSIRCYLHLHAEFKIPDFARFPGDETVVLEGAVGDPCEGTVFDRPVFLAAFPICEVLAIEDGLKSCGRSDVCAVKRKGAGGDGKKAKGPKFHRPENEIRASLLQQIGFWRPSALV
jgi:hypothetical protein